MIEDRRVEPADWHEAVRDAQAQGYAFFDWLSAVDERDAVEEDMQEDAQDGESSPGPGMEVVCHLLDVSRHGPGHLRRLTLRTRVPEGGTLASLTDLFAGAGWHERETHEMFGVGFEGFDDGTGLGLRPLLLPDGFDARPLRKDFVLGARASTPWPGAKEPGEGADAAAPSDASSGAAGAGGRARRPRKRLLPPGVPDPSWGPRP